MGGEEAAAGGMDYISNSYPLTLVFPQKSLYSFSNWWFRKTSAENKSHYKINVESLLTKRIHWLDTGMACKEYSIASIICHPVVDRETPTLLVLPLNHLPDFPLSGESFKTSPYLQRSEKHIKMSRK